MPVSEFPAELHSFAGTLNRTLRRLRGYGSSLEWSAAVLDGVAPFADAAALFAVENGRLRYLGGHGFELPEDLAFPLNLGRAFEEAVESKDTVVALRTASEVTAYFSSVDMSERAILLPVFNGGRAVAVLLAAIKQAAESPALELVAGMASLVLERSSNAVDKVQIGPGPVSSGVLPADANIAAARKLPYWANLDEEQRRLHLRAQRFARVKVAEMQLLQPDGCRAGREQSNVYLFLKKEIDAARESYRSQFLARPGMEDYLHLELVRIAADGDEDKLGVDYPGHLG